MTMRTPKFIYFDLGNVLLYFDHQLAARQIAEVADISPEQVWQTLFERDLLARFERGELSREQFHSEFCTATGTCGDFDRLEFAASHIFGMNYSMLPIVSKLEDAGYRLGILSNTCASHWNYVLARYRALFPHAFEVLALSYEIGAAKPDAKIYHAAAKLAGVQPNEIFYCDDIQANVDGALSAGFDAVLYTTTPALVDELHARGVRFNY